MFAFDRMISSFNLVSVIFSNVLLFSSSCCFNKSILLASEDSEISFCNLVISLFNVFSCLFVFFFLNVAYFIVSFLTVPFISSRFVFGLTSLFISAISAMLCIS